ncbi:ankyrin repeat domain-containing protein [Streptosporangium sp. NPDC000095]|uniref:ankyrin repeat domain-containing protein n=1 Tax=Streptosporangium sp. NPDC000095 TaxID=3366184 RepID=UPI00369CE205
MEETGWSGVRRNDWKDVELIRARLDAGADPDNPGFLREPPLTEAAQFGSPEVIAVLAARVRDVDAEYAGCTPLWDAVYAGRPDNARALAEAGADPWRPMMSGWSPGRLSLATPTPDLFTDRPADVRLSAAESAAVAEARRLNAAVGRFSPHEGLGVACVSGISAADAVKRLDATPLGDDEDADEIVARYADGKESMAIVGVSDVPGGCVVTQPWGFMPSTPKVGELLSKGTVCYAMYANAASGNQGRCHRDGVLEYWDDRGDPSPEASTDDLLARYLYKRQAVAYSCARAGLRLTDRRPIIGPPDLWVRLPERDYWH